MEIKEDHFLVGFYQEVQKKHEKAWHDCHIKLRTFKVKDLVLLYDSKFTKFPCKFGELQYCSNNATTPGASCLYLYQPGSSYKLGSDGAICTSTSPCRSCHLVSWHKSVRA